MKRIKVLAAALALVGAGGLAAVGVSGSANAEMSGWERIETTGTVTSGTGTTSFEAYCSSGKKIMGGGWDAGSSQFLASNMRILTNKPTGSGSGWTVTFTQDPQTSVGVAVVAVCATP